MMELNAEAILDELNDFEKQDQQEVPPLLEEYLQKIAKTGKILHPWCKLKPLLKRKMELVIMEFSKSSPPDAIPAYPNTDTFEYESIKSNILEALDFFSSAPFTIQRLCELITDPKKHYNRTDKYMRGLEKNLFVVSTIEPTGNESSGEREAAATNDWVNSDSSNDEHNYSDTVTNSNVPPSVNGTVLENFATVFPSANRIANAGNNIQVAIVTETSHTYQHPDPVDDINYDISNSLPKEEGETHYENCADSSSEDIKLVISSVVSNTNPEDEHSAEESQNVNLKEDSEVVAPVSELKTEDSATEENECVTCEKETFNTDEEEEETREAYEKMAIETEETKSEEKPEQTPEIENTEKEPADLVTSSDDIDSEPSAKRRKLDIDAESNDAATGSDINVDTSTESIADEQIPHEKDNLTLVAEVVHQTVESVHTNSDEASENLSSTTPDA